ncbi:uncharacterized protein F5891DRAFT_980836 [Suillus fuscotomentosus]|uniref:Uncharacterized protein n=1 Tax=Suillus fuscotomentosus TaxID=1912939 RepID=A0AAD4E5Z2_9AGAM|nr:uncharacterized protein F5891DRAFT_980836 [Suillus fuscotomentosus]KAG1899896.1 hypothetical protein F5891DRAFT_980836 [Suillus fuscotomentosus]
MAVVAVMYGHFPAIAKPIPMKLTMNTTRSHKGVTVRLDEVGWMLRMAFRVHKGLGSTVNNDLMTVTGGGSGSYSVTDLTPARQMIEGGGGGGGGGERLRSWCSGIVIQENEFRKIISRKVKRLWDHKTLLIFGPTLKLYQRACGINGFKLKARLEAKMEGSLSRKVISIRPMRVVRTKREGKVKEGWETTGAEWQRPRIVTDSGGRKYGLPSGRKIQLRVLMAKFQYERWVVGGT